MCLALAASWRVQRQVERTRAARLRLPTAALLAQLQRELDASAFPRSLTGPARRHRPMPS